MTNPPLWSLPATELGQKVIQGEISAAQLTDLFLTRIHTLNPNLNAFTLVLSDRAREQARKVDQSIAKGENPGPLAGVPFAVKNLYDINGVVTLAGSKINAERPPARADATLISRLENAGAILIGALNMGEYAYDFTGENCHHGNCHNPWQQGYMSGGSSSGSGSATAAGLAPISLGSDTNGSIRVPASLCGLFGLKPTYGRLPRTGSFGFSNSLDHLGPLARTVTDLATCFDLLQGYDAHDHACAKVPTIKTLANLQQPLNNLRLARLQGHFTSDRYPAANAAVDAVCAALAIHRDVELPLASAGRAAAYLITNVEGSALHLHRLQTRLQDFDPDTRDRFVAGTAIPAQWYLKAQQVRHHYHQQAINLFQHYDILIAPATPCTAPAMGEKWITIGAERQLLRPNLGFFTQPISAIGLPTVVVPCLDQQTQMPIGVQIIAAPWREDLCLRVAYHLEQAGFSCQIPAPLRA